jgi:hypothetical protein
MRRVFGHHSAKHLVHEIAEHGREAHNYGRSGSGKHEKFHTIVPSHETMLRALAEDDGEDQEMAHELSTELSLVDSSNGSGGSESKTDSMSRDQLADEYVRYRRESLRISDADLVSSEFLCPEDDPDRSGSSASSACIRRALFDEERSAKVLLELQETKL